MIEQKYNAHSVATGCDDWVDKMPWCHGLVGDIRCSCLEDCDGRLGLVIGVVVGDEVLCVVQRECIYVGEAGGIRVAEEFCGMGWRKNDG